MGQLETLLTEYLAGARKQPSPSKTRPPHYLCLLTTGKMSRDISSKGVKLMKKKNCVSTVKLK
jgi:hypothetical protein